MTQFDKKLGYYQVGSKEFPSKIEACIYGTQQKQEVEWIFNNHVFDKYNWTVEPEHTLDYYYNQRAKQLREKYDYIAISYSGGADSNNVLESFLRQGLHVDELIVTTMEAGTKNLKNIDRNDRSAVNGLWSEHVLHTLPMLDQIKNNHPKIKITVVDMTDVATNMFLNFKDASWVENRREMINPAGVSRFDFLSNQNIRNSFDTNKNIAIIYGIDKPRCIIENNQFYFMFMDRAANIGSNHYNLDIHDNLAVELFYWSPDQPELLIKQAHVIKKYIESNPLTLNIWDTPYTWEKYVMQEEMLKNIIYTTWNNQWFQAYKARGDWTIEYDRWFFSSMMSQKSGKIWQAGIEHVKTFAQDYVTAAGLNIFKKLYNIGDIIK